MLTWCLRPGAAGAARHPADQLVQPRALPSLSYLDWNAGVGGEPVEQVAQPSVNFCMAWS